MSKSYYTAEDFVADESFQRFVLHSTPADVSFWEDWISRHPAMQEEIAQAIMMVQSLHLPEEDLPEAEFLAERGKFELFLQENQVVPEKEELAWYTQIWVRNVAASALLVLIAISGYFAHQKMTYTVYQTVAGEKSKVLLPDSTVVYLNEKSSVKIAKNWTKVTPREVWLEGEAYFDVKHSPEIGTTKFNVFAKNVQIEVLGTQFDVWETKGHTKVLLHTGKIKMDVAKDNNLYVLEPGDMIDISRSENKIARRKVNPEVYTAWKDSRIVFDKTPLKEVVAILQTRYNQNIVIGDSALLNKQFTFRMPDDNVGLLLETLEKSLNLKIKTAGDELIIQPNPETISP